MKLLIPAIAITFAVATHTFAGGHTGNSGNARAMAENINTYGGGIASAVSGQNASEPGDSGWGNAGSRLTGSGALEGEYTPGGQVSGSGTSE